MLLIKSFSCLHWLGRGAALGGLPALVAAAVIFSGCAGRSVKSADGQTAPVEMKQKSAEPGPRQGVGGAIDVEPSIMRVRKLAAGEKALVSTLGGQKLKITNIDDYAHTFMVKPVKPFSMAQGYESVPAGWLVPEIEEFVLGPRESRELDIRVEIPQDAKISPDSRFHGAVEVKRKKPADGALFEIAMRAFIFIETGK